MFFNSIEFLIFLPLCFILYWFVVNRNLKLQNAFILVASYFFYGWWDYRFLGLIAFSTVIDYSLGIAISKSQIKSRKKLFLFISLAINLGLLGFFKYFNFFVDSWIEAFNSLGYEMHASTLNIILPVGISFYTFQTLSYTIDVYREKLEPSKNLINFAAYVAFFPQLVAGPIERATNLLPQFSKKRVFNEEQAISGVNLILWGLFQKVVIADSCAPYVNSIFNNYESMNSLSLILGAVYFAFQIYCDFAGYSNIAIGTARLLGFDLMRNFNYPYFSRDMAEFWRRWHISLSTWFRDYLYIPLGGSRGSKWMQLRNVFIIFMVSGLWHGANWTFVFWGFLHALFFVPILLLNRNRNNLDQVAKGKLLPSFKEMGQMLFTFLLACIAWVFFRAPNIAAAFDYLKNVFTEASFKIEYLNIERYNIEMLLILFIFVMYEWFHREEEHPFTGKWKWIKIASVILMLLTLGVYSNHQDFIYFQF
ncbi:D-alanyl-lipoteichoic acid acyltransferase DltB (MBOAT superfamily) [Nonlabens xylanidelens]|uniref:D-alanyl-lipoteichoic acid acyltransferase DltB (MBOAT superfamily) n=1 Tax=Nonlabens xylanidelens TaxID=191564 RepID=A0A2S6ILI3_9FLAO|nr:MBOAT family O-acyltransferase [Nonlabens xylanidelens]PPK95092.1 D-alanyl-lipoteichoic acid acyltransferase DltB (MBOAT superfamily) [Nonlabens xylanidelens]PQJ17622.1 membrane-bound O-acyltransferase family protein [Nonlabens xylanidelens]